MGRLRNERTGAVFELLAETAIGRGAGSDLLLSSSKTSKGHALVRWTGGAFLVRDKGSTNGTWLNQKRLTEGQDLPLGVGDVLEFGGQDEAWRCIDLAPPAGAPALATDRLRHSLQESTLHVGPPNTIRLIAGGQPYRLSLSPGEYNVVRALAEQRVTDRAQGVSREGWAIRKDFGEEICGSVLTLNQHLKRLRDKVRDLDVLAEDATHIIEQADGEIRLGVPQIIVD
jgi:pSer/pThr/pTyr-binding forkhead associated (FHA) protein